MIQGDVLNEFIYTPGQVQTATINVAGALKKEFDITPYNLGPNLVAGHFQVDCRCTTRTTPTTSSSAAGTTTSCTAPPATTRSAAARRCRTPTCSTSPAVGVENGVVRTDWTRPYNPGNLLLFGADADPWNAPKPFAPRLGEFFLYDEYDPRRAILFNADGTKWGCAAFSNSGHTCIDNPPAPAPSSS